MSTPTSPDISNRPPRPMAPSNASETQAPMSQPSPIQPPPIVHQTPGQQRQQQPQQQQQPGHQQQSQQTQPQQQPQSQQQQQQQQPHQQQPQPLQTPQQQSTRPPIQTSSPGIPQVRTGEYLVLLTPNSRQPGVPMNRYPYLPIQSHQMMSGPGGARLIQRPAIIRGIGQQGFGVHPTVIPTSQPFGMAGVPASLATAPGSPIIHQAPTSMSPQMTPHDALTKGTNFLNSLLTRMHIKSKKTTLQNLIQALIDGTKTPDEFASELQKELNSGPQVQLVPFLTLMLPTLRQSMNAGQTKLPGIRPPNMQSPMPMPQTNELLQSTTSPIKDSPIRNAIITNNVITPASMATPSSSTMPAPLSTPSGQPTPAKKKKTPLPPGQKSAYAIKKEAREARKREKELAAQNIKSEKVEVSQDGEQKLDKSSPKPKLDKPKQTKQKKTEKQLESLSATLRDDDDVNDVAAMGGVNLAEESQKIMASGAELVGTQIRSCKDEAFFELATLSSKISVITKKNDLSEPSREVVTLISHALQERLKDIVERLGVLAEHRAENLRLNPKYEVSHDIKAKMKFLAELDRIEKRRYEEQERELLMRVAKSRSKVEDPEQIKLRQKAKDMQRAEQEEVRQREANQTALLAIGPRKKAKTETASSISSAFSQSSVFKSSKAGELRTDMRRLKRVNMRDLQVLLELDRIYLDRLVKISAL